MILERKLFIYLLTLLLDVIKMVSKREVVRMTRSLEDFGIDPRDFIKAKFPAYISTNPSKAGIGGLMSSLSLNGIILKSKKSAREKAIWMPGCHWSSLCKYVNDRASKNALRSQRSDFQKIEFTWISVSNSERQ